MITEQDVLNLGFRIFGLEEDDPYYKVLFLSRVLGKGELVGNFNKEGEFEIYSMNKNFSDIDEIVILFIVCGFKIDSEITNKYGSDKPIQNQEYKDKIGNSKSVNEFIVELLRISQDKRELPIVIRVPNDELFSPKIKMMMKNGDLFGGVEKMIVTY